MNHPRHARGSVAPTLLLLTIPMALTLAAAGCGSEARQESVSGVVTLDGKPLDDGNIQFTPDDDKGLAVGSLVHDGHYNLPNPPGLTPGDYRVSITAGAGAAAVADVAPDADMGRPGGAKGRIPARYNERTTLRAEVTAGGSNAFDFKLSGKTDPAKAGTASR